jgi:hypothetical protein
VAGFPKEPGQYHLPRAAIEPPEVLQREIYPFVEKWRRHFHTRTTRKKGWAQGGKVANGGSDIDSELEFEDDSDLGAVED